MSGRKQEKKVHDQMEKQGSQVIARAAQILRALESQPQGMSITALAKQTGLPRTTVHRLVISLESQQLLTATEQGVRLGPALTRLAASAHTDIVALSRPAMESLGRRTRETVDLSVYRGTHAILVSQFASDRELRVMSPLGTAFPCHCTAHGKALWATLPEAQIAALLGEQPEARTPQTINSLPALAEELAVVRQRHYAIDREEHARGVCGIAVTLASPLNERYALSLAVPALRFDEQLATLLPALLQSKAEIESLVNL